MKLEVKLLDIEAGGKRIAILNDETAKSLGIHSSDRIRIKHKNKKAIALVNTANTFSPRQIGLFKEISNLLKIKDGEIVEVICAPNPEALKFIKAKIRGERLQKNELKAIVKDVVERHFSDIELSAFVTALHIYGLNMDEAEALSKAMVETGERINLQRKKIFDKHSIGGIPGDKTSILIVPIIAAAGFTIPKTSSRAVTSPAGTADRFEALCPVNLTVNEISEIVNKTNGCIAWGGSLELAPADDLFIQVEYPLGIDPLLLPSIMSKKKVIGATHLVVDIPTGRGAKIKTIGEAKTLAYDFIDLGKRLGINVHCGITYGEQPLGYAIGPNLEAKEALNTIMGKGNTELKEKAISLAGILLEMAGIKNGKIHAEKILESGKAELKLREIIQAQGGNPKIQPNDIIIGNKKESIITEEEGRVLWINNENIVQIAKEAGCPKDKGAGILLKVKIGDIVKKEDILFEIYAERNQKLNIATQTAKTIRPIKVSKKLEERMLIDCIKTKKVEDKPVTLER